jgi:hypothetical protein
MASLQDYLTGVGATFLVIGFALAHLIAQVVVWGLIVILVYHFLRFVGFLPL